MLSTPVIQWKELGGKPKSLSGTTKKCAPAPLHASYIDAWSSSERTKIGGPARSLKFQKKNGRLVLTHGYPSPVQNLFTRKNTKNRYLKAAKTIKHTQRPSTMPLPFTQPKKLHMICNTCSLFAMTGVAATPCKLFALEQVTIAQEFYRVSTIKKKQIFWRTY